MANRKLQSENPQLDKTIRASVSFPEDQYGVIEKIATQNRVSVAWVVREAVKHYIDAKWPLLGACDVGLSNGDHAHSVAKGKA
jgi:hypothetical protein